MSVKAKKEKRKRKIKHASAAKGVSRRLNSSVRSRGTQGKGDALPTLTYVRRQPSLDFRRAPPHYYSPLHTSVCGCAARVFLRELNLTFSSPHSEVMLVQRPLICMHAWIRILCAPSNSRASVFASIDSTQKARVQQSTTLISLLSHLREGGSRRWRVDEQNFKTKKGWIGKKRAAKVRGVSGSSSQEIHRGVKCAPLGDSPDCSARNAALSKPVSGAALSFRFIVWKAEDDRVVASRKSVSPCHKQGHAPSSSILFQKSSFSFPLLFSRMLSFHLSCLRLHAGFFRWT